MAHIREKKGFRTRAFFRLQLGLHQFAFKLMLGRDILYRAAGTENPPLVIYIHPADQPDIHYLAVCMNNAEIRLEGFPTFASQHENGAYSLSIVWVNLADVIAVAWFYRARLIAKNTINLV